MSNEQLLRVNDRCKGTQYFDTKAAADVLGSINKIALMRSPLICTFEFGGTKGYWTGSHAIIQVEDCIDCAKEVFGDRVEIVFLFDHSSGHSKKRTNGLDVKGMNKSWGGKIMRPTLIENGSVGQFYSPNNPAMVLIGQEQSMFYRESDMGPFDMSPQERQSCKYDIHKDIQVEKQKSVNLRKTEIIELLMETELGRGLGKQALLNMRLADLQNKANALSIAVTKTLTTKICKGWVGKGKGLLQVLWERGFIDELKVKNYRIKMLDEDGNMVPEFSLEPMMANCPDFLNEMSQLEYVCQQLGTKTITTTSIMLNLLVRALSIPGDSQSLFIIGFL